MNIASIRSFLFFILLSIHTHTILGGFFPGTPVKTITGYQPIETISSGNKLFSHCPVSGFIENEVKIAWKNKTESCVIIRYLQAELIASVQQLFYLPESDSWVAANQLQPGDTLLSLKHGSIAIDAIEHIDFSGFTHCVQFETIHNFCVSDDDIVVHNIAIRIDLLNPPTLAVLGIAVLVGAGLCLIEYGLAKYGYHINFFLNADGSLGFNPFKQNDVLDLANPYLHYHNRFENNYHNDHQQSKHAQWNNDNHSYYNNYDYTCNRHNDLVAQHTYHTSTFQQKDLAPAVSITHISQNKEATQTSPTIPTTHLPTTTPDPEIGKKPSGCPTPIIPESINPGGFEPTIPERTIFITPIPKIEKPHICIHDPIPQDISRIVMTVDRNGKKPKTTSQDHEKNKESTKPESEIFDPTKHPHGRYVESPKHHKNSHGNISKAPRDGQKALDNSIPTEKLRERIAIVNSEIIVLKETLKEEYHGYVVSFEDLQNAQKKALIEANLITQKGKIVR